MTIAAINWVLKDAPGLPAHAFGVLLGLANHAREDGTGAYASQATLAGYARKSDRAVRNDIKELLAIGLIVISPNQNPAAHIPADARPVVYDLQVHLKREVSSGSELPAGSGVPAGSQVPDENQDINGQATAGTGSPLPGGSEVPAGSTASRDRKPTSDKPSTQPKPKKKTSSSSARATKPAAAQEVHTDAEALCHRLAELMIANECKPPTITQHWRDEARRLLDIDGRDFDKAMALLEWCQHDSFWKTHILSMPKFREKYDQLRLRAVTEWDQHRKTNGHQPFQSQTDPNAFSKGIQ